MDKALQRQVDAIFADVDHSDSPGCALGVVRDGALIYARGYGMANLECDEPIAPDSVFHVASVSKQFTCLATLLLAQDGRLKLDDDVRTYVPELPDYGHAITLRHLAHHTSGLRDQWDLLWFAGWREDDVKTDADVLYLASRQRALNFRPGDEYLYCNTGYTLLALVVSRVSGLSFRAFTQARIFEPLGMRHTHFRDDHTELVKGRTSAYKPLDGGGFQVSIPMFDTAGATSLFTTVDDLARWARNFETKKVGGDALDLMHVQGVLNNGETIAYALGQAVDLYRGVKRVQHGGADAGYRSHLVRFPEQRLAVIVLSNLSTADPGGRAHRVADACLGDALTPLSETPSKAPESPSEEAQQVPSPGDFVGRYVSDEVETAYDVAMAGETLVVRHRKHGDRPLKPAGEDRFDSGRAMLAFCRSADGRVRGFSASTGRVRHLWFGRVD